MDNTSHFKRMLEPKLAGIVLRKSGAYIALVRIHIWRVLSNKGDKRGPETGGPSFVGAREPRNVATT